ncbi:MULTISPECIES: type II toxin-antitoxin system HipA family toxin [Paraburkholderia]|uniref:type II toxin-antitoxin system HipA family toxin n=1 Tax=Paraburkholderia TaxID=1822464 RepID=UPI00224EE853|nr:MULTISPECIES: HipA domain-containing protein [Paraburkholderia]MCX4162058.1 HipA domain-containing protein [Paraburkholderia megapolitana]MDN7157553.1 type II toxin-antitoxin system HipA family toxin [Paraburkholderia sp. CHISQ3]MDQ6494600.1 type II toxin-antitoxin system HipA family toxin [Paraburkholderia megapolitana]
MATSDQRAYVYLQLPQSMEVVTAGFYELDFPQGVPTGSFVYNPAYLQRADAVPLDPYELPLAPRRVQTVKLKGIFGPLRDASPDAWGRRIIEKHTERTDLTEVDYLLHSPEDRAGALSFGRDKVPPALIRKFNQVVQLEALLTAAEQFMEDDAAGKPDVPEQMFELLQPGTSMGGARPKNVVEDTEGLWLAKFPDRSDRWNNARVEGAMLTLAQECGLRVARHRIENVAGKAVLLVQRFDRTLTADGYLRHRMISGLTALGAEDSHGDRARWSYLVLADELRRRSARPAQDLEELFRRMVFNALISNTDDHPRNHALIAPTDKWELSPAYDLTPNPLTSIEKRDLAMTCGIYNRYANRTNLLSQHGQFKLSLERARAIVDQIQQVVIARWHAILRQQGVTPAECDKLNGAFNYPGFELDPAVVLAGQ